MNINRNKLENYRRLIIAQNRLQQSRSLLTLALEAILKNAPNNEFIETFTPINDIFEQLTKSAKNQLADIIEEMEIKE